MLKHSNSACSNTYSPDLKQSEKKNLPCRRSIRRSTFTAFNITRKNSRKTPANKKQTTIEQSTIVQDIVFSSDEEENQMRSQAAAEQTEVADERNEVAVDVEVILQPDIGIIKNIVQIRHERPTEPLFRL